MQYRHIKIHSRRSTPFAVEKMILQNQVQTIFATFIVFATLASVLLNYFGPFLPKSVSVAFRYGKFSLNDGEKSSVQVPKAWFKHFYIYSSVVSVMAMCLVTKVYFFGAEPSTWLVVLLDAFGARSKQSHVTAAHTFLALTLFTLQCLRRFHDTSFVSVFAAECKMHFMYYIFGYSHYTGCLLAILVEAPIFSSSVYTLPVELSDLNLLDYAATILFLWAWYHQGVAMKILADLRKNKKGEVITSKHGLPRGDWFEYISSPHSTAEILMYISLQVILWQNPTWLFVLFWVTTNQVQTMVLSHWWYKENIKDFPPQRKALIPFIY